MQREVVSKPKAEIIETAKQINLVRAEIPGITPEEVLKQSAAADDKQSKLPLAGVPKASPVPTSSKQTFNATNDNIEWAKWTWNPVTGCLHGCKYCYARDIANRFFGEYKFSPHFYPERLSAPANTTIPVKRINEPGIKNVFVCSMADLFGEWVGQADD
ncbi:MAG: DUF5131 family protein [Deltaproteobacteria bacterium]|nr:DUF5131 family protein [Deltaproteobacteria bacterium]